MASTGMRTPGGSSKDRGELFGIVVRDGKYIVHMRLPGPEKKKTWIKRNDLESAKNLVEICSLYIDAFNALPTDHPDRDLHSYQKEAFEEFVLQQLEAEGNSHQELGIIQRIATEESTDDIEDGRIDESTTPPDASVSRFAHYEVGTNLENPLPQDFRRQCDAELQAVGIRDSVAAAITPELDARVQAGVYQVMCSSGALDVVTERLPEHELEEEKLQQRQNLERQQMQQRHDFERKQMKQRHREDVLSGWKQCPRSPNQEASTELGKQGVLKDCKCASVREECARVLEKRMWSRECLYTGVRTMLFFFSKGPVPKTPMDETRGKHACIAWTYYSTYCKNGHSLGILTVSWHNLSVSYWNYTNA